MPVFSSLKFLTRSLFYGLYCLASFREAHGAALAVAESMNRRLFEAAEQGNLVDLDTMLQRNVSPFASDEQRTTALLCATSHGHFECAKRLTLEAARQAPPPSFLFSFFSKNLLALYLNQKDTSNRTALWYSVHARELALSKLLIESGANVDEVILNQAIEIDNAALLASIFKDLRWLNYLFDTPEGRETILHRAASRGKINTVGLLVSMKPDLNARNLFERRTALHAAVEGNNFLCVDALLDAGASPDAANRDNVSPLHTASCNNYDQSVAMLIAYGANVNRVILKALQNGLHFPSNPLLLSIENECREAFIILYKFGRARANYATRGELPLIMAARKNLSGFISVLASESELCDLDAVEGDSLQNALHIAVSNGYLESVMALLEAGIDFMKTNADGSTALHLAVEKADEEMVALLLEKMSLQPRALCQIDKRNKKGDTPLMVALDLFKNANAIPKKDNGFMEDSDPRCNIVELLLKYTSRINTTNNKGETPLDRAVRYNIPHLVSLFLVNKGEERPSALDCERVLFYSFMHEQTDCVKALIDAGTNPDCTTNYLAPLHSAIDRRNVNAVRLMLQSKVHPALPNNNGVTPLEHICSGNNGREFFSLFDGSHDKDTIQAHPLMQCFNLLREYGAKISLQMRVGRQIALALLDKELPELYDWFADFSEIQTSRHRYTLLHLAVLKGRINHVDALLNNGANPNDLTSEGETPLHIAARMGNSVIVCRLLLSGADPNRVSKTGDTALHNAVRDCRVPAAAALLRDNAIINPNIQNSLGETPIILACKMKKTHGQLRRTSQLEKLVFLEELLVKSGVSLEFKDKKGNTALDYNAAFKRNACAQGGNAQNEDAGKKTGTLRVRTVNKGIDSAARRNAQSQAKIVERVQNEETIKEAERFSEDAQEKVNDQIDIAGRIQIEENRMRAGGSFKRADNKDADTTTPLHAHAQEEIADKSAEQLATLPVGNNDAESDFALGVKLECEAKVIEAMVHYQRAAKNGHALAQNIVGMELRKEGNIKKAKIVLTLSADQGNISALNNLACIAKNEGNHEEAKRLLKQAADKGAAIAQFNIGLLLEREGKLVDAIEYYGRAAAQEDGFAQNNLGLLFRKQGNNEEAKRWYRRAIDNGNISALNNLACIAISENDYAQAERLLKLAIDKGSQDALFNLGFVFEKKGLFDESKKYYKLAIVKGSIKALFRIAGIFEKERNFDEAQKFFELGRKMFDMNQTKQY